VNRVYLPHPLIKWQYHLITGLEVVPERLAERLGLVSASPPTEAFRAAEALLEDTAALAEAQSDADLSSFRHALAERRRPLDPECLAREELRQETGITARQMRHLGHLYCASGMSSQGFDVFLATGLTPGTAELEVEEQDLVHRWFPRAEVEDMIRTGIITDDS